MNKYNVLEYSIIFYDQRNKELANVRYSLVFFPVSGGKETFTHVTNEKGRTKPIRLILAPFEQDELNPTMHQA